jgi:hypothetical protein
MCQKEEENSMQAAEEPRRLETTAVGVGRKKKDEDQIGESVPPSNKRIPLKFLKAYMEFQTFILAHKGHV